jgi:hypothetical protein
MFIANNRLHENSARPIVAARHGSIREGSRSIAMLTNEPNKTEKKEPDPITSFVYERANEGIGSESVSYLFARGTVP